MFEPKRTVAPRLLPSPKDRAETVQVSVMERPAAAQERTAIKPGSNLQAVDVLVQSRRERADFLQTLARIYALTFQERVDPVPAVISFTSRKGILYDLDGNAYFIKQKPQYSLQEHRLFQAAHLQIALSEHLSYVPPVIKTKDGSPYAQVHNATYFLTPYISGNYYMGRREQSLSAAYALGEMHATALCVLAPAAVVADSREETDGFLQLLEQLDFSERALHRAVIEQMQEALARIEPGHRSMNGWLHGDFAPFNIVYHRDRVIAVNDFDNVLYGPLCRDIAECILTHCGIHYAGTTSSMRAPILTTLDSERAKGMLQAYLQGSGLSLEVCAGLSSQVVCLWFELLALGLLRGDFSLGDVDRALPSWNTLQQSVSEVLEVL